MSQKPKTKIGYIYKTTNLINGKIYIGKHNKESFDPNYYGSGTMLKRALQKYGKEFFDISVLQWYDNLDDQIKLERHYINIYHSTNSDIGYNIGVGGEGGDITVGMSKEDYESWIDKLRKSHLEHRHSDDWKQKMSQRMSGDQNPASGKSGTNTGKTFDKNWRENISKSLMGVKTGSRASTYYILKDNDMIIKRFRGKAECIRYCRKELGMARGAIIQSLDSGNVFKDLTPGTNQYKDDIIDTMLTYPNYSLSKDDTEISN